MMNRVGSVGFDCSQAVHSKRAGRTTLLGTAASDLASVVFSISARAASFMTSTPCLSASGEDFSTFNDTVLDLLEAVPELRGDPDLGATNQGVTILWLK